MLITKGDGTLRINPQDGEIKWVEICSPNERWYWENGFMDVTTLEGRLNLDSHVSPPPECEECPEYNECLSYVHDDQKPENTYCSIIDDEATSKAIMDAFAAMGDEEREDVIANR